ncbi:MAG: LCP family protein, partial [Anaerovibrio sp.]|uniref:LCP family protein n=1 Tax=Anaerovibrio sp. TaxID=1872532 RepID=UPI001B1F7451
MFLLLCAFVIAAVAGALFASSVLFDKPAKPEKANLMTAKDKIIVMIMGVDEREGDVGRSDTLMVATLDPKKKKAALLSIPRDTRVKIKGYGFDKINAAYAYGGHELTRDTVEDLIGVHMEHHILINIKSFKKIIDAIGGVDINVEKRMYYEDVWDDDGGLLIDLQPGLQHMDGDTAITYVRYRDEEGDIGRIRRQQKFMQAVMDKVTSPAIIPRIPSIIKEVVGSVQT